MCVDMEHEGRLDRSPLPRGDSAEEGVGPRPGPQPARVFSKKGAPGRVVVGAIVGVGPEGETVLFARYRGVAVCSGLGLAGGAGGRAAAPRDAWEG